MHPFSPGDVVVCVDDEPLPERIVLPRDPWIRKGSIYRIESTSTSSTGEHGVCLVGLETRPFSDG